jgi:large subunit ribosomal protein L6e
VNQTYVIATSTKVDISGVDVSKFDDKYFAREKKKKVKKTEGELFETEKEVGSNLVFSVSYMLQYSPCL